MQVNIENDNILSTITRQKLNTLIDLDRVFIYREPSNKFANRNIYRFCVFNNKGTKVKFLHNAYIYDANEVKNLLSDDEKIKCWFRIDGLNLPIKQDDVVIYKKSQSLLDFTNSSECEAPFPEELKKSFTTLKRKKSATIATILACEQKFVSGQCEYNRALNGQREIT